MSSSSPNSGGGGGGAGSWTEFEWECLSQLETESSAAAGGDWSSSSDERGGSSSPSSADGDQFEQQLFESPDVRHRRERDRRRRQRRISGSGSSSSASWDTFEQCAQSVARLYRDGSWTSFQEGAAGVTQLYKESVENQVRGLEAGLSLGRQRLLKELICYLKSTSRHNHALLRREDLLAFLAGRKPPLRHYEPNGTAFGASSAGPGPLLRTLGQLRLQSSPRAANNSVVSLLQQQDASSAAAAATGTGAGQQALHLFHQALTLNRHQHLSIGSPRSMSGSGRFCAEQQLGAFLVDELRKNSRKRRQANNDYDVSPKNHSNKRARRL